MEKDAALKVINDYWSSIRELSRLQELAYYIGIDIANIRANGKKVNYPSKGSVIPNDDDGGITITPEYVEIYWEEYFQSNIYHFRITFPTYYLWDKDYKEKELQAEKVRQQEKAEKERIAAIREKELAKQKDMEIEKQEKALYQKLKEKYGD